MFKSLNSENYVIYAMKNYYIDEHISVEEFRNELKIITYINKLLNKDDDANHRLILNHIITARNVFSAEAVCRMCFFKIAPEKHQKLKTYLYFLKYLPESIEEVNLNSIELDKHLLYKLENL